MPNDFTLNCPVPKSDHATVQMAHGGGGRMMRNLIESVFLPAFGAADGSQPPHDAAVLPAGGERLAFTTDSFVVSPLFFPGGDIGTLAVCGTVNDLAMAGARPAWLSAGFILEEGLPIETLRRVAASMAETARAAGMRIVTGDTKVVDHGRADGLYINTSGVGWVPPGVEISPARVRPGDAILLSGDLGRHGMAIMSVREGLGFEGALESDCAPLAGLVEAMLSSRDCPDFRLSKNGTVPFPDIARPDIHCFRDLTRGGLAAALNEIALDAQVGIEIDEAAVPVTESVASACEILGLDPLYVPNEGRLVAFVATEHSDRVLSAMQSHSAAVGPCRIGTVTDRHVGTVELRGRFGSSRIIDLLSGEQMPRIC